MHEFTSISVSSYDAASLADKLTEKSAAGWDVVAIVPAGTNITAYLSREGGATEPVPSWDDTATAVGDDTIAPVAVAGADTAVESPSDVADEVEHVDEPAPVWEAEPVAEAPAPVEEPAGWAVAPEPVVPPAASVGVAEASPEPTPYVDTSSSYGDTPAPVAAGDVGEPQLGSTTAGYDTGTTGHDTGATGYDTDTSGATGESSIGYDAGTTTASDAGTSGYDAGTAAGVAAAAGYDAGATTDSGASASSAAADQTAATTDQAAVASAAPAGWYADPSGRYELRYWDGSQWTEHVSRAGQQYTDPPVA